jgi:hypothetical protein
MWKLARYPGGPLSFSGGSTTKPRLLATEEFKVNVWEGAGKTESLARDTWHEGRPEGTEDDDGVVGFVYWVKENGKEPVDYEQSVRLAIVDRKGLPLRTVRIEDAKATDAAPLARGVIWKMLDTDNVVKWLKGHHAVPLAEEDEVTEDEELGEQDTVVEALEEQAADSSEDKQKKQRQRRKPSVRKAKGRQQGRQFGLKRRKQHERQSPTEVTQDPAHEVEEHDDVCSVCGVVEAGATVLCCDGDGCQNVAHLACAGVAKAPEGDWHCKECLPPPARGRKTRPTAQSGNKIGEKDGGKGAEMERGGGGAVSKMGGKARDPSITERRGGHRDDGMGGGMLGGTGTGTGGKIPFFMDKVVGAIGEANTSTIGAFGDAMRVTLATVMSQMIQSQPNQGFQKMDHACTERLLKSQSESQTRNLKISTDAAVEMVKACTPAGHGRVGPAEKPVTNDVSNGAVQLWD